MYGNTIGDTVKYFKNTELAKIYSVSEKSVRNWIQAASQGKLDLQLMEENGKNYIANTAKNTVLVEQLAAKGKKYQNSRGRKIVTPKEKFYKLYSPKQMYDIISNVDIYREIPLQYCYFNSGAENWDKYTQNLLKEGTHNPLTDTVDLLSLSLPYIGTLIDKDTKVNVIDIGVGNGLPVRGVLEHFDKTGQLNRYIGLDISPQLLDIAQENIQKWFNGRVKTEGHVRDFNYDRFDDLLLQDSFENTGKPVVNLVFFLGGTINNLREPSRVLATIHDSMGKNDLFLFSKKLDTEKSRRHFDVAASDNLATTLVLNLLNIDKSYYELEQFFDEHKMARELQARLNVSLLIEFEINGHYKSLELNKGDRILLWRARHQTAVETIEQFDHNGFDLVHASKSLGQEYLLMISKIKSSQA